jgi:serine protease Do
LAGVVSTRVSSGALIIESFVEGYYFRRPSKRVSFKFPFVIEKSFNMNRRLFQPFSLNTVKVLAAALFISASTSVLVPSQAQAQSARGLPDFADLVEKAGPAVVNIRTTARVRTNAQGANPSGPNAGPRMPEGMDENDPFYEFFRRFFPPRGNQPGQPNPPSTPNAPGGRGEEVPRGVGSGFIVSGDGFVLTNHHVVDGADEIYVTLTDKRELKAKLIGSDRRTDVAVVKIEGAGFPTLKFGDVNRLRVGEWVVAIGSPFGLENTVTAGIVSAKGRETGDFLPFIQTDVAVNPGNSGGPLINMNGEVVGINSQIYSRTGGFQGISFAIPIDEAQRVSDQLRATGRVVRGRIGVGIAEVTKDVAEPLGLPRAAGALVRNVEANGPADKAGVEVGDIIQKFDGKNIEKSTDLPRLVGSTKPGNRSTLSVWRKGSVREIAVVVSEMEADRVAAAKPATPTPAAPAPSAALNVFGLSVSDLTDEKKTQLKIKNGVLVDTSGDTASRAGIRQGDVILGINNLDVTSAKQFNEVVAKLDRTKSHVLLVRRGDSAQFVPLRPTAP